MSSSPHMAVETSKELFNAIVSSGIDKTLLVAKSNIDITQLEESEKRYPVEQHLKIWQAAEELDSDSCIGLHMGQNSNPYLRGIVGLLFAASPNLQIAAQNKIKYTKILAEHVDLVLEEDDNYFALNYSIDEKYFHYYEIERVFSGFLSWVNHFVGEPIYPIKICCQFSPPKHVERYRSIFNCPIHFNHSANLIVFNKALYQVKNSQYNDYLYSILQARADKVLQELDTTIDFVNGVRSLIAGRLSSGNFSAEDIAASVNMSKRTFYRKLQEEGASYQNILDDERKKMALSYLRKPNSQIQNIAYLLGYSDQRSFNRAFKRWTQLSPSEYLRNQTPAI